MSQDTQAVINKISKNPEDLRLLRKDPEALGEKLGLKEREIQALQRSDLLLVGRPHNPLVAGSTTSYTFTTGSTITGDVDSPVRLEDLPKERLLEVTQRILQDPDYAERVQRFLKS
ncbi:hypothetical protein [Halalkalicoccus ordinarius]|uniref:hypothetical protein n=1 Tax=Halalkalicoccus ordinarius TaxID=3116651 RepID=UPI00300F144F